jgi:hypothetical protein
LELRGIQAAGGDARERDAVVGIERDDGVGAVRDMALQTRSVAAEVRGAQLM